MMVGGGVVGGGYGGVVVGGVVGVVERRGSMCRSSSSRCWGLRRRWRGVVVGVVGVGVWWWWWEWE